MMRPRLRIPRLGRIASGLTSTSLPQLAPLSAAALPFAQSSPLQVAGGGVGRQQSRSKHTVPPLNLGLDQDGAPVDVVSTGIPGFLSSGSVEMAWSQYQTLMLEKLDQKIAETDFYNKDLKSIILSTAREPQHAAIFNYASMAHNNHFFFDRLATKTVEMPGQLKFHLEKSFGSIETLRREMVYTADAMFGPGFVWLVRVQHPGMQVAFKILTTYLAGTPYAGAHWRRQAVDSNTQIGNTSEEGLEAGRNYLSNSALGQQRRNPQMNKQNQLAPGGIEVHPVLCLNTWEHVWLRDYGVGVGGMGGKLEYAEAWWYRINWDKVSDSANLTKRGFVGGSSELPSNRAAAGTA